MLANDQQLAQDHAEVLKTIKQYSSIRLINTSGEPADEYDIEYRLKGYSLSGGGKVAINDRHRVKISLPFGYPHFPPTVKPLSSIFHPDIDDNVVRIADYWEEVKSLPKLIVYIGDMISGTIYHNDNPFNPDAAQYYQEHIKELPLDSLKTADEEKAQEKKQRQGVSAKRVSKKSSGAPSFLRPLLLTLLVIGLLCGSGVGILTFLDSQSIKAAQEKLAKAQTSTEELDYTRAKDLAEEAMDELSSIKILQGKKLNAESEIHTFLDSEKLQQGLLGRIRHNGKWMRIEVVHSMELLQPMIDEAVQKEEEGNITEALNLYERALEYAREKNIENKIFEIEQYMAKINLAILVQNSVQAHKQKNYSQSIAAHRKVLDFINDNKKLLPENISDQFGQTSYLLTLDQISYYRQQASQAETKGDLEESLANYSKLIDYIGKSGIKNNDEVNQTLVEAMQQSAQVAEKLNIQRQQNWLLRNYKDIFLKHYPASVPEALKNPQATFVKYQGNNMIYDLSCLERGQGSVVVRLRLFYQFNTETNSWSIFRGEI